MLAPESMKLGRSHGHTETEGEREGRRQAKKQDFILWCSYVLCNIEPN